MKGVGLQYSLFEIYDSWSGMEPCRGPSRCCSSSSARTCRCNSQFSSVRSFALAPICSTYSHTHMRLKWKVFDFRSRRVRYKARRLSPLWTQSKTGAFKITDLWLPRRERKTLSFVLLNFQKHFSEERPSGDWFRTWGERILRAEFLLCMQPSHLLN
jgi:hypothetical protein